MTKARIAVLLDRVESLSPEAHGEIAQAIAEIATRHEAPYRLDPEEAEAVEEGLAQAERGEFVSDEEMASFFRQHLG